MNNPEEACNYVFPVIFPVFFTIEDVILLTGWSLATVQKLFNDPHFPATDYGKCKLVESHAFVKFFSERREKKGDYYWRN